MKPEGRYNPYAKRTIGLNDIVRIIYPQGVEILLDVDKHLSNYCWIVRSRSQDTGDMWYLEAYNDPDLTIALNPQCASLVCIKKEGSLGDETPS